jgi:epoxyqueuosine reductase
MEGQSLKKHIQQKAEELGFLAIGFAKAEKLNEEEFRLKDWLSKGYHGEMQYMENHFEKRLDPTLLVEGSKTVISLAYNYFPQKTQNTNAPQVAKYAYGEDYHKVVKDQAFVLFEFIQSLVPNAEGRVFVDSAPVMERQWAEKSGLGWIGKHSLLIRKGIGSFFFLAEIICSLEVEPDAPTTDHCGSCTACIDACPTNAIIDNKIIDSNACISYLTIEKRTELSFNEKVNLKNWAFGCDICQDVCPWNRFASPTTESRFNSGEWINWNQENWNQLTPESFKEAFGKSPLTRAGFEKIKNQSI